MLNIAQIVFLSGLFFCVAGGTWLILARLAPDKWRARVDAIRGRTYSAHEDRLSGLKKIVQTLGRLSGEAEDETLQQKLAQAGFRDPSAVAIYTGLRVLLGGILLLLAWLTIPSGLTGSLRALWVIVAVAGGFYLPHFVLSRKIRQRRQDLVRSLPDALELMTIAVDAGLGLDAAMMRVTQKIGIQSTALRREFEVVWMEIQAGVPRASALRSLVQRTGVEDINLLVSLLNSADRLGVPVGEALHNFSATLRLKRHQRAEEHAGKIPVKLLFPLIFLVLPVLLLLLVGPSVINIMRAFVSLD